jgi:hypothetical protein
MRVHAVIAVVRSDRCLGEPLRLVIHRTRPHRIHVAPVALHLRMHEGIAIALRRRRMKVARAIFPGHLQRVQRARRAHEQSLHPEPHIIRRAGRRGEVVHVIHTPQIEGLADVSFLQPESRLVLQVGEVGEPAGRQIVHAQHAMAFGQQRIAKVRTQKSRSSRNEHLLLGHAARPPQPPARAPVRPLSCQCSDK